MQLCNNATMQQSTDATMHKRICCKKPMNALPTHYASLQQYNRASTQCTFGTLCTLAPKRNKRWLFLRLYIKIIKNNPCTFGAFCTVATMQLCNNAVMRQCANEHEQKTSRYALLVQYAPLQQCKYAIMQLCTKNRMQTTNECTSDTICILATMQPCFDGMHFRCIMHPCTKTQQKVYFFGFIDKNYENDRVAELRK